MNLRRTARSLSHAERSLIILLLVAIGLAIAFLPTGATQQVPPQGLAAVYADAFNGNTSPLLASPYAVLHTPEGDFAGLGGIDQFEATLGDSFTDLAFETQSVETIDNLVVISFTMTGINTGSYHNAPANCAGVSTPGTAHFLISDAGVVEQWIDYDRDVLADQIRAFNEFDPGVRPGCADYYLAQSQAAPTSAPPPAYLGPTECRFPY